MMAYFDSVYPISNDAKEALSALISEKEYPAQALIQSIGSRCKTIYFVKAGCARIYYVKDGNDITEHFAFDHEMIVRAESLFTGEPTYKGIQTLTPTLMIAIQAEALFKLYDRFHDIERLFRLIFEREYVNTIHRVESFQFKSPQERYVALLETTDYVQKIPLKYIASYLGITQVSLSRIRARI